MTKYTVRVTVVHGVEVEAQDEEQALEIATSEMSYMDMEIHSVDADIVGSEEVKVEG